MFEAGILSWMCLYICVRVCLCLRVCLYVYDFVFSHFESTRETITWILALAHALFLTFPFIKLVFY